MWFIPTLLWGAVSWLGRSSLTLLTGLLGQVVIGGAITYGLSAFVVNEMEAGNWLLGQVSSLLSSMSGSAGTVVLPLASVVEALRLVDCFLVILNAHLAGMGIKFAASLAKGSALHARVT